MTDTFDPTLRRVPVFVSVPEDDLYAPSGELLATNRLDAPPVEPERQGALSRVFNRLIGTQFGEPRYQTWPEKMVRSALTLPGDVVTGKQPVVDPETGRTAEGLIERTQDLAGLAMTGGLAGTGERGMVVGSGPVRSTPVSKQPAPVWYSPVEHALEQSTQARATGAQWLATLRNSRGVKPEELDWTGLTDYLAERADKPVSRPELHEFLRDNRVELQDVTKNNKGFDYDKARDEAEPRAYELVRRNNPNLSEESDRFYSLVQEHTNRIMDRLEEDAAREGATRYAEYQLPGGSDYREHLITMPPARLSADKAGEMFRSSHWDEPNIVAHVRSNVREMQEPGGFVLRNRNSGNTTRAFKTEQEAADHLLQLPEKLHGSLDIVPSNKPIKKRSLHLEEVQSDWHQAGRRKGYALDEAEKVERRKLQDKWIDEGEKLLPEERARLSELMAREKGGEVPDAPWKKTWHELALKRMVRLAAEKGLDRVSWTPGEAQAARYDLSKQIDQVMYSTNGQRLEAFKNGRSVMVKEDVKPEQLPDLIGKEAAQKLMEKPTRRTALGKTGHLHVLENADLKVGGEGMRGFYDQMLPKAAEKLFKEHGVKVVKGKIGPDAGYELRPPAEGRKQWTIERDGNVVDGYASKAEAEEALKQLGPTGHDVWYFDIPPAMRDAALRKGMPLFSGGKMFVPTGQRSEEDEK